MPEAAGLAMAGLEFFAVLEAHRDDRHEHELRDAVPRQDNEGLAPTVPARLPRTILCLCPSPERGSTTAQRPGSSMWSAIPLGIKCVAPGSQRSGALRQARRSMPADPLLA